MQTSISARHGELSAETQETIRSKVAKLTRFAGVTSLQVTVDLGHRETPHVELRVTAEHADDFFSSDTASNVLAALDSVIHKVENQLRKHKEKATGHRAVGLKHQPGNQETEE